MNETNRLVGSNAATVERADANKAFLEAVEKPDEHVAARTRRARRELLDHLLRADDGTSLFALSTGRTTWAGPSGVFGKALTLVETALDENDLAYATGVVEQLLAERPQSPRAHELRGVLEAAAGDWAAARKDWRLAERRTITDPEELRKALNKRVRRERSLVGFRESVAAWSETVDTGALDEETRALVDQVLDAGRGPRRGDELEAGVEALLVRAVVRDETAAVAALFEAYAALRSRTSPRSEPDWLVVTVKEATALSEDGDFPAAAAAVEAVATTPGALRINQFLFLWARLLSATSRYTASDAVLGLVAAPAEDVGQAQFNRARTAWITHRYADGEIAAQAALAADPERRSASRMLEQIRTAAASRSEAGTADLAGSVAHVAYYPGPTGNFGDVVLPVAVRAAVETATTPITWRPYHAHQVVDDLTVDEFNAQRAVVVGGGGLFLPDTSPNGNSGWQWNVDNDHVGRITTPLALFAVGYNLFPGQSFKGTLFQDSLVRVAEQAQFLGLRNHGSIDQVRSALPDSLQDKVRYVPCPTTILGRIRPLVEARAANSGRVLLNAAFDRRSRRFGEGYGEFLEQIVHLIDGVRASGAEIAYAAHLTSDERLVNDLRKNYDRELDVERLYERPLDESLAVYRDASLVIGMRGHATMVPFGLGTPVLSIVSHPKMRYFLDDIGRPEWGVEAAAPDLGAQLLERTLDVVAREDEVRREVHGLQEQLVEPVFSAARSLLA
ncbi:polysaccharide pyruvyl transferase family protein [Promicromonospora sukumoe]|uniref:polysaccharide pyruvyl transferase family protein n=1 Tax=Promicromonospora sukumoe TaxID=88382 RepID=UPI003664357A